VLFDLDGVLVEGRAAWFEVMRAIAHKFGYPGISAERMERAWGRESRGCADVLSGIHRPTTGRRLQFDVPTVCPAPEGRADGPRVFEELRANCVRVAVVTNSPGEIAGAMLDAALLHPDVLVSGNDVCEPNRRQTEFSQP
jgi:beta-phosphoglucomutase-like phosphatase (HAD superfamily)